MKHLLKATLAAIIVPMSLLSQTTADAATGVTVPPVPTSAYAMSVVVADPAGDVKVYPTDDASAREDQALLAATDVTKVRYTTALAPHSSERLVRFVIVHGGNPQHAPFWDRQRAITWFTAGALTYKATYGDRDVTLFVYQDGQWQRTPVTLTEGFANDRLSVSFPTSALGAANQIENMKSTLWVDGTAIHDATTPATTPLRLLAVR